MTTIEKVFADEYVFLTFNGNDFDRWTIAVKAAKTAGYEVPDSYMGAQTLVRGLFAKSEIAEYVDTAVAAFIAKMHPTQRRTLWTAIAGMTLGEPTEWKECGLINVK